MAPYHAFTMAIDIPVYFCDPQTPANGGLTRTRTGSSGSTSPRRRISPAFRNTA
jgi:hypothetical protein